MAASATPSPSTTSRRWWSARTPPWCGDAPKHLASAFRKGIDKLRAGLPYALAVPVAPDGDPLYRGYRFPAEIISHAVWLYYRFALSHRDIEDLLAAGLRRRRRAGCKWHLDEVQLKIKGKRHWLCGGRWTKTG